MAEDHEEVDMFVEITTPRPNSWAVQNIGERVHLIDRYGDRYRVKEGGYIKFLRQDEFSVVE